MIGNVTFGPNIFYSDGNPKPVQILSTFPSGKELIITYTGPNPVLPYIYGSVLPSGTGTYYVNVKFKDNNVVYDNINNPFKLNIKEIPTSTAPQNISKETDSPQDQKNIITFTTNTGTVNFSYNVVPGNQFTIEYPLNSGILVYDSGLIPSPENVNNTAQNKNISFFKDQTGQDNDKCLITVYSTNNNTWKYTISAVDATAPNLPPPPTPPTNPDLQPLKVTVTVTFAGLSLNGEKLNNLEPELSALEKNGTLTLYESLAIANVLDSNNTLPFVLNTSTILGPASGTNIKVTVEYTQDATHTKINLQYTRLTDSLAPGDTGAAVIDCHYYKYIGKQASFNTTEAKSQLKSQINTDTFLNTVIPPGLGQVSIGQNQKSLLLALVEYVKYNKYNGVRFGFQKGDEDNSNGTKIVIYDGGDGVKPSVVTNYYNIYIGDSDGVIYINPTDQVVEIVYPSICTFRNFGT